MEVELDYKKCRRIVDNVDLFTTNPGYCSKGTVEINNLTFWEANEVMRILIEEGPKRNNANYNCEKIPVINALDTNLPETYKLIARRR